MSFLESQSEKEWFLRGLVVMGRLNNYKIPEPITDDPNVITGNEGVMRIFHGDGDDNGNPVD